MKKLFNYAALFLVASLSSVVQAEEIRVMTSGGFTAAYKILGPEFAKSTGNTLDTALGPSMGKAPEAIPNRLARGEQADVVIMVGYALDDLIKQGKVDPLHGWNWRIRASAWWCEQARPSRTSVRWRA